jgi:hypothetical protein
MRMERHLPGICTSGQAEELFDKVGLGAQAAGHQIIEKQVRGLMILTGEAEHFFSGYLEEGACIDGGECGRSQ